jgi:DNA (cytosine-5)-methyltransferase 1
VDAETAAGGGLVTTALTRNGITGLDDNTAQGGQLVPVEVWQQQGSKLSGSAGTVGTMRRGNGNVTGGVPFLAQPLTAREGKGPDSDLTSGNVVTHALTAEGADASEDGTGRGAPPVPVTMPTLTASMGGNAAAPGNGGKDEMVVPVYPAQVTSGENRSNLQRGDPSGTPAATSRPAVGFGEALGNAAFEEVSPSIRTGTGGSATSVAAAAVRRLTPVECERLQGYPDGWTATSYGRAQSDSARYRQLGNSIAVPVFEWVARRLMAVEQGEAL